MTTSRILDREERSEYELVVEARDGGSPARSSRARLKIAVTDVNDNAPEMVDPREDVVSVREEQPTGTEVVRVRAIDRDQGNNASLTYSLLKGNILQIVNSSMVAIIIPVISLVILLILYLFTLVSVI